MRDPEELCHTNCEPKGQCYICGTILCAHKVIEHLDRGHIIYPLPYHVRLNPIFDQEDVILESNESILDELREMSTRKIIELQDLEEEVEDSVYVTKDPLTVDQVRKKLDALEPIHEFLSQLDYEIKVRLLKDYMAGGWALKKGPPPYRGLGC